MEKMTNVKALSYVIENFEDKVPADVFEKLVAIRTSFEKKSASKKPTANQEANEGFKATIIEVLTNAEKALTVTEIQTVNAELGALSNQRVSALLRQLVETGKVVKTIEKKKSYFTIA